MTFYNACRFGNMQFVNKCIQSSKQYCWHLGFCKACIGGHLEIVVLISKMSKVNWNEGLLNACQNGHLEIVQFLITNGANCLSTGLYAARRREKLEIVQLLITKIEKDQCDHLRHCYNFAHHKSQITKLLYLGTPLHVFRLIDGFQELQALVGDTKHAIKMSQVMISDLLNIITGFIII